MAEDIVVPKESTKIDIESVKENFKTTPTTPKTAHHNNEMVKNKVLDMPVEKLVRNKKQPRKTFEKENLQELANSIKEKGVLQPVIVRPSGTQYEIIAGERRWRASQLAGLKTVPAIVKEVSTQDSLELALIENIQRQDLNPIEEAEAYKQLIDNYNLTQQDLATKMGKERVTIANNLRLLNLTSEVRELIRDNQISIGQAKVLLTVNESDKQNKLAKLVVKQKLTVKKLEKLIKNGLNGEAPQLNGMDDLNVSEKLAKGLALELQKITGTKVKIDYKAGKGKIMIQYYSDQELTQFVENMRKSWNT